MTGGGADGGLRILRPTSSLVSFWAAAAIVVLLFGDAALRGAWGIVARWLPLALLVLWVLWVVLWRSSVRFDRTRVVVVNPLRIHEIPWARVIDVRGGVQLRIELDDGRTVDCFGGPFPRRIGRRDDSAMDAAVLLEAARESAPSSDEPATVVWDVPAAAVGVILLAATVVALAFPGP